MRLFPALAVLQSTALSIATTILKVRGTMSDTPQQSVICPGQQAMFEGQGAHYLRVVFMAYWADAMPSAEVFYITSSGYQIKLNPRSIAGLEGYITDVLHQHGNMRAQRMTYLGYSGVEMTREDLERASWRVVSGADVAANS